MSVVIVGVGHFGGFPPPPIDPMPILSFSELEGCHGHRSHSMVE